MTQADGVLTCAEVRAGMDDYRDRRMDATDASLFEKHLASCEVCRGVLENRIALLGRVKGAVRGAEVPPDLAHRVQFAVARTRAPQRFIVGTFGKTAMSIAAALLITAGAFYFWPEGDSGPPKETQQQFIARVSSQVAPVMRVGLNQHLHCGVFREYPAIAPALSELVRDKQVSAALVDAVETHAPRGLHVVMAHHCRYEGRQYIHVVARGDGHLMSLLITRKTEGESIAGDLETTASSGPDVYSIDAFETPGYLVYLVSDKTSAENLNTLKAMEPLVKAALL